MTFLSLAKELYKVLKSLSFSFSIMASMTALATAKLFRRQTF